MAQQLDPLSQPWLALMTADEIEGMNADLAHGRAPGLCSHGTVVELAVAAWRREALERCQAPADWSAFDPAGEPWFRYLGAADQAQCRLELSAASSATDRLELYGDWRATAAALSDPYLVAQLRAEANEPSRAI